MRINRQPVGLLGFLGIKNFGRNPDTLATVLSPVWETSDLYLSQSSRYSVTNISVAATGGATVLTVPNGKVWKVYAVSIRFTPGVGAAVSVTPCLSPQSPSTVYVAMGASAGFTNAAPGTVFFNREAVIEAGTGIGYTCEALTAGPVAGIVYCRYVELDG